MRGFSTLEILIAFAIGISTLVAVLLVVLGTPTMLENIALRGTAIDQVSEMLDDARIRAKGNFSNIITIGTTTIGSYETSGASSSTANGATKKFSATISWEDGMGETRFASVRSAITNTENLNSDCDPVPTGDWSRARAVSSARVTPKGSYPITDLAFSDTLAAITVQSTSRVSDPTIFFVNLVNPASPKTIASFDNAPMSTVGFSAVEIGDGYAYAGNSFGSASAVTCRTASSCDQIRTYKLSASNKSSFLSSYKFPTSSTPKAIDANGRSAAVQSLTYYQHRLYVGLVKTKAGSEFNILDARNPARLVLLGSYRIGLGVEAILVQGNYAYVATEDHSNTGVDLLVLDISNPRSIKKVGTGLQVPGIAYPRDLAISGDRLLFVRTHVNDTVPEFYSFDLKPDGGLGNSYTQHTYKNVYGIESQGDLAFLLTGNELGIWDTYNTANTKQIYQTPLGVNQTASALKCHGGTLYVASSNSLGFGYLTAIAGS
ncbi:MAG: hypothetical protein JWN64_103 [Parcubacteria group bacterium]|nr:hypothetical protein [Parcubacteria group bacterium]